MIRIDGVRKRYPEFEISVDMRIGEGEIVSILGPSGSGKTTTLRLIAGFERPDSGSIALGGRDVSHLPPEKRGIGYVFQDYTLFPHMSVAENVAYGLRVRGVGGDAAAQRVETLLTLVDLAGYGNRRIGLLSGGERQRVAIARSLAVDPSVLLLDEPFSSVDEVMRQELREEILRLRDTLGITVVFVTHSRQEALAISDRVAVIRDGRLIQYDTPETIYRHPVDAFAASFVGGANFVLRDGSTALVRPEQISLVAGPRSDSAQNSDAVCAHAVVESVYFLGHAFMHRCRTPEGDVLTALHDTRLSGGTEVSLQYNPRNAWQLPKVQ